MFEKVINELRNIEYALNYWIGISQKNKRKRFSRIQSNESIHLRSVAKALGGSSASLALAPDEPSSAQPLRSNLDGKHRLTPDAPSSKDLMGGSKL